MVMGWIWTGMVLLALGAAVLTGQTGALTAAALEGAASAIRLALGLAGALCLWSGAAKALERAGGMRALARLARPVFRRLFPQTAQDETAMGYLTANVAANLLGLGNAATPMAPVYTSSMIAELFLACGLTRARNFERELRISLRASATASSVRRRESST